MKKIKLWDTLVLSTLDKATIAVGNTSLFTVVVDGFAVVPPVDVLCVKVPGIVIFADWQNTDRQLGLNRNN
jgi:hypothetical protein